MRLIRLALVAILSAGSLSCSDSGLTAPTSAARVDGTWDLITLTSNGLSVTEAKASSRFVLTLARDRAVLKADCNTCAGDFRLDGDAITLNLQICTQAVCTSSPLDTQVAAALNGQHTVRLDASHLQFASPRGEITFER